jgi:hypothetical protein
MPSEYKWWRWWSWGDAIGTSNVCFFAVGKVGGEDGTAYQEEGGRDGADGESIFYTEDARNDNDNITVHC